MIAGISPLRSLGASGLLLAPPIRMASASMSALGSRVSQLVNVVIVSIVFVVLAVQVGPIILDYVSQLAQQMMYPDGLNANSNQLVFTLGSILDQFGSVVWYGTLLAGVFYAIYRLASSIFR